MFRTIIPTVICVPVPVYRYRLPLCLNLHFIFYDTPVPLFLSDILYIHPPTNLFVQVTSPERRPELYFLYHGLKVSTVPVFTGTTQEGPVVHVLVWH